MDQKSKKRNPLLLGLVVLLGVTVLLCAATVGLWLHGRSAVNQEVAAPVLPQQEAAIPGRDTENLVEYQGKRYRYNENMRNILLMGIDSDQNPDSAAGEHDQADVVVLAALDLASDKMTLINLSRDTVCNIQVPDQNGELTRLLNTQLALSYAYGDGQYGSCEMTRDAVSNIFYGLPIQGYGAYYMNGIAQLNDAVGGVTVNVIDDFPFWALPECRNMLGGQDVTLTGEQAVAYIRCRLEEQVDANQLRMRRQKQYMLALIAKAKESVQENPATALTMYDAVEDYLLTDLDPGEIAYLAAEAASMSFDGEVRSLAGELILNPQNYAEFHLDQEALFQFMLDVFYCEEAS